MSELSLKEAEIKSLKENIAQKDTQIISSKVTITQKESLISEIQIEKKQENDKLAKANEKLIGKVPLGGSKHIF